jgi:hypothetical protein
VSVAEMSGTSVRSAHFENEKGNDDGERAIAQCLHPQRFDAIVVGH